MLPRRALKQRISVTLSQDLLVLVDQWSQQQKLLSRSAAIENLISAYLEELKEKQLADETEAYYLSLSDAENKERREWSQLSSAQALSRFKKSEK